MRVACQRIKQWPHFIVRSEVSFFYEQSPIPQHVICAGARCRKVVKTGQDDPCKNVYKKVKKDREKKWKKSPNQDQEWEKVTQEYIEQLLTVALERSWESPPASEGEDSGDCTTLSEQPAMWSRRRASDRSEASKEGHKSWGGEAAESKRSEHFCGKAGVGRWEREGKAGQQLGGQLVAHRSLS